jgi:hypothetical protein
VSDLVNEAVRAQLAEDADDLEAFKARRKEPAVDPSRRGGRTPKSV